MERYMNPVRESADFLACDRTGTSIIISSIIITGSLYFLVPSSLEPPYTIMLHRLQSIKRFGGKFSGGKSIPQSEDSHNIIP
jgi:hypothetical protein